MNCCLGVRFGVRAAKTFLWVMLCAQAFAQGQDAKSLLQREGGSFQRLFYGDYRSPAIRAFEAGGAAGLESLIADGRLMVTEADAVRLALENNVDINVERYGPYFALWETVRGRAVLNPALQFNAGLDRQKTPTSSALQGGDTLLSLNTVYDFTFSKPFEPGLDLELTFQTRRSRSNSFFSSLNPSLVSVAGISVTQHLLKDLGRISRGRVLRIARNNYDMSREAFALQVMQLVSDVLNTYWDLLFIDEDIKEKEASRELARIVLEQNRIQAQVGTMSSLDVIQAEAEVAAREQQVVVARHSRLIAQDQLKRLISSQADPGAIPAAIVPVTRPLPPPPPRSSLEEAIRRATEIRPEVRQALLDLDNRKIHVDYTRNQLKPTLDLVAAYSQNGLGGNQILRDYSQGIINAPVVGVVPGGFWDALDSLFSRKYLGFQIGFNFRVPIGNDAARADNAQAQIDHRQAQERLRALRQKIALEVRQAYNRLELDKASVAASEVTVRYMQQRLEGEQEKFSLGAGTTRSIIEAQRDLQAAVRSRLQAQIDLIRSRIALDRAAGDILAAHGIELQDVLRPGG